MEKLIDPVRAEAKVLSDICAFVSKIRQLSAQDVKDIEYGILLLRLIRAEASEDLNQIQHECLILQGLAWLVKNGFEAGIEWEWNPRQTGTVNEPDLRGSKNGMTLIAAEASASELPSGKVDTRMRETLEKLSRMPGEKFYFVRTDEMTQRARTKVTKANWPIKVVQI